MDEVHGQSKLTSQKQLSGCLANERGHYDSLAGKEESCVISWVNWQMLSSRNFAAYPGLREAFRFMGSESLLFCCAVLCVGAQSCLTLCTLWTVSCQAPLSMGILQSRILEWDAMPSSKGSSRPRDRTQVSHVVSGFFTAWATREAQEYWSG